MSALQALFAADMLGDLSEEHVLLMLEKNGSSVLRDDEDTAFTTTLLRGVVAHHDAIDAVLEKTAPQWPIPNIAPIDRNILRIGLYELLFGESATVPPKVALNEAIELGKTFGGESSGRFINGVLGSVYRELGSPRKEEAPKTKEKEYLAGVVVCAYEARVLYVALVQDLFGKWTLPKTRYKPGELSDHAALRSAHDVLGLSGAVLQAPLSEHEYDTHDPHSGVSKRRVGYFLACSKKEALSTKTSKTVVSTAWFSVDDLPSVDLYDDLRGIIESGIVAAQSSCL